MTSKEQQIKNSFIYLLPIIVGSVVPLITLPIFTRILTKEDYGVLALAQIYAVLANGLANIGLTVVYERNYFQYRSDRLKTAKLLFSILLFVTLNFLFLASLTFVFRETFSKFIIGSAEHGNILFWAFCAQFSMGISYYYLTYFKNSEIAKDFVVYTIGSSLINFIISLYLVAYLRIGIIGIVYAQLFSGITIFGILSYKFTTTLSPSLSKSILYESLKISYPLTPRIFLGVIGSKFDQYMISLLASVGGVGIYSIGQKVANIIFTYMVSIHNVYSPQVYNKMFSLGKKGHKAVGMYLTPFVYASIAIPLMISLFSEEILTILMPKSFHGAIDIVIILSMYYGSLFFGMQPQLIYAKKTSIISLLTIVRIIINVALNIPFIIKWGVIGAAWATLLTGLFSGAISFIVAQHYYEIKWQYRQVAAIFLTFLDSTLMVIILRNAEL